MYQKVTFSLGVALALTFVSIAPTSLVAKNICREAEMRHGLFSIKTDGSGLRLERLLSYPAGYPEINYDKLHVSFDGRRLAYLRCVEDKNDTCQCDAYKGAKEVVVSDLDGSDETIISQRSDGFNDYPNWSPNSLALVYMYSAEKNEGTDLYRYDLDAQKRTRITNTPLVQESDNFWNANDYLTVVTKDYQLSGKSNFIVGYPIGGTSKPDLLTKPQDDTIRHCCYADPKISPDNKYLVYSRFEKANGAEGDWDIILKDRTTGREVDLSQNDFMDLYPLFSKDGSKLFWTRYDHVRNVTSYVVKTLATNQVTVIDIVGAGVRHAVEGKKVLIGAAKWGDWFHPTNDRLIFPATFKFAE